MSYDEGENDEDEEEEEKEFVKLIVVPDAFETTSSPDSVLFSIFTLYCKV